MVKKRINLFGLLTTIHFETCWLNGSIFLGQKKTYAYKLTEQGVHWRVNNSNKRNVSRRKQCLQRNIETIARRIKYLRIKITPVNVRERSILATGLVPRIFRLVKKRETFPAYL